MWEVVFSAGRFLLLNFSLLTVPGVPRERGRLPQQSLGHLRADVTIFPLFLGRQETQCHLLPNCTSFSSFALYYAGCSEFKSCSCRCCRPAFGSVEI